MKEEINKFERVVKKYFGSRCPDFHYACWTCMVYMAIDIIKDALDDERLKDHKHETNH